MMANGTIVRSPCIAPLTGMRLRPFVAHSASGRTFSASDVKIHKRTGDHRMPMMVRASEEGDADVDFEERLAKLRAAKGTTGRGQTSKAEKSDKVVNLSKQKIDYTGEVMYFEGRPATGDLVVNVALGATLLWLPLSIAAIGRFLWLSYKITDKRISVISTSPLRNEQLDVAYGEIADVVGIGRGVGLWGDMVLTLKDGTKVELRSIEKWIEVKKYILDQMAAVKESPVLENSKPSGF